jgi:hypothetical protein
VPGNDVGQQGVNALLVVEFNEASLLRVLSFCPNEGCEHGPAQGVTEVHLQSLHGQWDAYLSTLVLQRHQRKVKVNIISAN